MENFAEYILSEKDLIAKMEIVYYLSKKQQIFFDKSVIFKTEIARLFMNYMELQVDRNLVLTACLLCNCKKSENPQLLEKIKTYAKEGSEYLKQIGFDWKVCKLCEEVNRYSGNSIREKESDILELVDQYGGMLLDREERIGFKPDEALVLLEHRNLKDKYNRFLETFITFIQELERFELEDTVKISPLRKLVKIYNKAKDIKEFIREVAYDFEPAIDNEIKTKRKNIERSILEEQKNPNRALFSAETTRKIMGHIITEDKVSEINEEE